MATALSWHLNFDTSNKWYRRAWKSAGELAKEVNMTERTVQKVLSEIRKSGWLTSHGRTTGGRGSHIYELTIPESSRTTPTSVVHPGVEYTEEWGQTTPTSGVRVHPGVGSDYTEECRDSLKDSLNDTKKDTSNGDVNFSENKKDIREFKEAYPGPVVEEALTNPYAKALEAGATPQQLLWAAKNYATACEQQDSKPLSVFKFFSQKLWDRYGYDPDRPF